MPSEYRPRLKPQWPRGLLLGVSIAAGSASAHHAPSLYDTSSERLVTATVLSFEWIEPHTQTKIRVIEGDASETIWTLEGMSPSFLGRRNWNSHSLEQGDRITVAFFPRKDGTTGGMFIRATLPDGTLKVMAVPQARDR